MLFCYVFFTGNFISGTILKETSYNIPISKRYIKNWAALSRGPMPLLVPHGVVKTRRGLGFCGVVLFGLQILCFCFLYVATVFLHHKFVRHKRGFSIYLSVLFVKKVSSNCSEYANKTVSFQRPFLCGT
ncbi:uncharacterized protein LOC108209544 [Daucus carota subsp. sativus]|uniref:uncharacterized protein LOC108209544 n=1 Tax=Daucus carota subsp. sativus TaxID=79200 RepID=UPI0030829D8C